MSLQVFKTQRQVGHWKPSSPPHPSNILINMDLWCLSDGSSLKLQSFLIRVVVGRSSAWIPHSQKTCPDFSQPFPMALSPKHKSEAGSCMDLCKSSSNFSVCCLCSLLDVGRHWLPPAPHPQAWKISTELS